MNIAVVEGLTCYLRDYRSDDLEAFTTLVNDPAVMRFVDGPMTREASERLFCCFLAPQGTSHAWAVFSRQTGQYVGHAAWRPFSEVGELEIIFLIASEQWGRGHGGDVARLLVAQAFASLPYERVFATAHDDNDRSTRVLEQLDFVLDRRERDANGMYCVYALERAVWEARFGDHVTGGNAQFR